MTPPAPTADSVVACPPSPAARSPHPYPGLRPFRLDESDIFFGRDEQIDSLLERLHGTRFLSVVGASGCGKSSLIGAGLVNAVRAGYLTGPAPGWRVVMMQPRDRPLANLADGLVASGPPAHPGPDPDTARAFLRVGLRRGPNSLLEALPTYLGCDQNLLLIVDQFEELFRFREHGNPDEADAFAALLLASTRSARVGVYIVLTMRSDFIGECAVFAGLPEAVNDSQYLVPRLSREQRAEAIEGPAQLFGGSVDPALLTRLLNDLGPDPDNLPVLQHVLRRLWNRAAGRPGPPVLTLADYEAVGGVTDALADHADEVLGRLGDRAWVAEVLFRALAERTPKGRLIRRLEQLGMVAAVAAVEPELVAGVVEEFRHPDVNFLTPAPPAEITTDTVLDVSHESLIRQWPRLREWVAKEAESARIYSRAKGYADEWAEGKDMARLLRPPELDFGLRWQREGSPKPNPAWAKRYDDGNEGSFELVNQYLDLSAARREEERQEAAARDYGRRRQQVIRFGGPILVVLLAVFAGLAGLAFRGWSKSEANLKMANDNADQARKNEEAAIRNAAQAARERVQTQVAYLQRDGIDLLANHRNPALSLLMLQESVKLLRSRHPPEEPSLLTAELFWQGIRECGGLALAAGPLAQPPESGTDPTHEFLIAAEQSGDVLVWKPSDDPAREPTYRFKADPQAPQGGRASPDGRWVVTADPVNLRLWDLGRAAPRPDAEPVARLSHGLGGRPLLTFTPDGKWLFVDGPTGGFAFDLAAAPAAPDRALDPPHRRRLGYPGKGGPASVARPVVSGDSRWCVTTRDGQFYLWNLTEPGFEARPTVLNRASARSAPVFSPDHRWLMVMVQDERSHRHSLWHLQGPDGPAKVKEFEDSVRNPGPPFCPGRPFLVNQTRGGALEVWRLPDPLGPINLRLVWKTPQAYGGAFSAGGKWLIAQRADWLDLYPVSDLPADGMAAPGWAPASRLLTPGTGTFTVSRPGGPRDILCGPDTRGLWVCDMSSDAPEYTVRFAPMTAGRPERLWGPAGRWLVTTRPGMERPIRLWDLDAPDLDPPSLSLNNPTEQFARQISGRAVGPPGSDRRIQLAAFDHRSQLLFAAGKGGGGLWEQSAFAEPRAVPVRNLPAGSSAVGFAQHTRSMATAAGATVTVWRPHSPAANGPAEWTGTHMPAWRHDPPRPGVAPFTLGKSSDVPVTRLAWAPRLPRLAVAGGDGSVVVWTWGQNPTLPPAPVKLAPASGAGGEVALLEFSPTDPDVLLVLSGGQAAVYVIPGASRQDPYQGGGAGAASEVRAAAFTSVGARPLVGGVILRSLAVDASGLDNPASRAFAGEPAWRRVRFMTVDEDGTLTEWTGGFDPAGGTGPDPALKPVRSARRLEPGAPVRRVAFSPDGRWVAIAGPKAVRVWAVYPGQKAEPAVCPIDDPVALAFDARGFRLSAIGADGQIRYWQPEWDHLLRLATIRAGRSLTADERRQLTPETRTDVIDESDDPGP